MCNMQRESMKTFVIDCFKDARITNLEIEGLTYEMGINSFVWRDPSYFIKRCGHFCTQETCFLYKQVPGKVKIFRTRCCVCEIDPKTHPKDICEICRLRLNV